MAAAGWPLKAAQKHTLTLPTGVRVEVKRPSLITMLANGGLPTSLAVSVWKMASNSYKPNTESGDDIRMIADQVVYFVAHTLTSIKVHVPSSANGKGDERPETDVIVGDDGIARGVARIEDIPDSDKMAIFIYSRGIEMSDEEKADAPKTEAVSPETLSQFPAGSEQSGGDAGSGGEPVRAAAVEVDRNVAATPAGV